jgi:multiple sugar transport system substrate-binding protein
MSRSRHRLSTTLATLLMGASLSAPTMARADDMVFLSTQIRPVEEAQRFRDTILKHAPAPVTFVPEMPPELPLRIKAEQQGGAHTISLIGALHGELQPLMAIDGLMPLDDLAAKLKSRGFPDNLLGTRCISPGCRRHTS